MSSFFLICFNRNTGFQWNIQEPASGDEQLDLAGEVAVARVRWVPGWGRSSDRSHPSLRSSAVTKEWLHVPSIAASEWEGVVCFLALTGFFHGFRTSRVGMSGWESCWDGSLKLQEQQHRFLLLCCPTSPSQNRTPALRHEGCSFSYTILSDLSEHMQALARFDKYDSSGGLGSLHFLSKY